MTIVGDAGELREDIPLKEGNKSRRLCSCNEEFFSGPKFISFAFAVLSLVITIALLIQIYYGDYQVTPHGSVASDNKECSTIGTSILKDGGNSIDAAIATAFCLAVVNPHTTGLDAGGQMLLYSHQTRINPISIDFTNIELKSRTPPRLVIGLAYIHKKFASLPWKKLVQPAALLARNGFAIPKTLEEAIQNYNAEKLFEFIQRDQKVYMKSLGKALQRIGNFPEKVLYSFIPKESRSMEVAIRVAQFKNYNIYVPKTSPIGLILLDTLQQIENENFTSSEVSKPKYIYNLAKIMETVYEEVNVTTQFYEGTSSNIAVMDLDDLYVSLITGMYAPFGSRRMTQDGYLMDVNEFLPTTRIPVIITEKDFICGRRIILGASDVATASQIIASLLIGAESAAVSIENARFNILSDGLIGIEETHKPPFESDVIKYLKTVKKVVIINEPYNSCNVVEKTGDNLNSHSDSRGGGLASRF